jgi:MFS family permease
MSALRRALRETIGGLPSAFWWLWVGTLVNSLAQFVFPFVSLFLASQRFSVARIGWVVSFMGAGALVSGPLGGFLADRVGRKPTMVAALVLSAGAAAWVGFARTPGDTTKAVIAFGVVAPLYRPAVGAAIADLVPAGDRDRAYGLNYWAVNVGFAMSLVLGGLLARGGFERLFIVDAATTLAYASIVLVKVPETRRHPGVLDGDRKTRAGTSPLRDPIFMCLLGLNLVFAIVLLQFNVTVPLDMAEHNLGPATYGALMAINGLVVALVQPFSVRIVSGRDPATVLAAAVLLTGFGYGLFGFVHTPFFYAVAIVIWTLGEVLHSPVASALVADLSPSDQRGRYQGLYVSSWAAATFLAPAAGSLVMDRFGARVLWLGCALLGVSAAAGHGLLGRARRGSISITRSTPIV